MAPWSRTRFIRLLRSVEIALKYLLLIEYVAAMLLRAVVLNGIQSALTATISTTIADLKESQLTAYAKTLSWNKASH